MPSLIERRSTDRRHGLQSGHSHALPPSFQLLDAQALCKPEPLPGSEKKTAARLLWSVVFFFCAAAQAQYAAAQTQVGSEGQDGSLNSASAVQSSAALDSPEASPELTPRAQAELKFVEEPITLVSPSPFFHQLPTGVLATLRKVSRLDPQAVMRPREKTNEPFATLQGASPLIRGGQQYAQLLTQQSIDSETQAPRSEQVQDALERQRSIDAYTASVADLEIEGGAYNAALSEELNALGLLLQQQGEHEEAVRVFDRAVHIDRINSGLHSLSQVQTVENKLASLLAEQRWSEADAAFEYLFFVQRRAYGDSDPRLLPILDSIAAWNLRAFFIGHGDSLALRLNNAMLYYSAAARVLQQHFGSKDERLVAYMRGVANSSYLMARHPELLEDLNRPEFRNTQTMMRERLSQPRGTGVQGFTSGAQALIRILQHELDRRDDALAIAEAFANLADWYLLFGRGDEAEQQYKNAWGLLANQPNADALLEAAFGRIVHLPTFADERGSVENLAGARGQPNAEGLRYDYADIAFDVSSNGSVRNVKIISAETEDNELQLRRLRRMVRDSYFRPIIKGGVPQRSQNNVLRYRYWY